MHQHLCPGQESCHQILPLLLEESPLKILEDRYEKSSIIITCQLPVGKWHQYFDEPTIADAILDRIIAKTHRIEFKGKSLRKNSKHVS